MRGMILAAGRGERMGDLTRAQPKPLLRVGKYALIEYALFAFQRAGITELVINVAYLGEQIQAALGDGSRYGVTIAYSVEAERLETGGGIYQALPLLGDEPFVVMSGDIITAYPLQQLPRELTGLAHLVLVPNPAFHPQGDFGLEKNVLTRQTAQQYTFGNVGVYHPDLFKHCEAGHFRLNQVLFPAIDAKQMTGELYHGAWYNVGDASQLSALNQLANNNITFPA